MNISDVPRPVVWNALLKTWKVLMRGMPPPSVATGRPALFTGEPAIYAVFVTGSHAGEPAASHALTASRGVMLFGRFPYWWKYWYVALIVVVLKGRYFTMPL